MDVNTTSETLLSLRGVTKRYGSFAAVDQLDLDIQKGEVFALLGPSGCGKSTTLRMIAGLEEPDEGLIHLGETILFSSQSGLVLPPQKRNMGMVFQSYAIWPHLNVYETVSYPLNIRPLRSDERKARTLASIKQVGLTGYEERPATNLSGGQQQRVALARALVYEPDVLLLDEPFSNLDLRVREQMRLELKLLQRRLHIGVILVTHDQVEALSLSDRIAVMNGGKIEQIGSPLQLYDAPRTAFVRDFIGSFTKIKGRITQRLNNRIELSIPSSGPIWGTAHESCEGQIGDEALLTIRPEQIQLQNSQDQLTAQSIQARIEALLFNGDRHEAVVSCGEQSLATWLPRSLAGSSLREGDRITLGLPEQAVTIWTN